MNFIQRPTLAHLAFSVSLMAGIMTMAGIASVPALAESVDPASAHQTIRSTPKDAEAMLKEAIQFMGDHPHEQAFAVFNNQKGKFVHGDLYVFVIGLDGIMHANGGSPEALVGTSVEGLRDADGKLLIRDMLETAKTAGAGNVDYVWLNRVTNKIENKSTYFKRAGDYVVAVGSYLPRSSAEQASAFLKSAVAEISTLGASAAFREFNDPHGRFVHDDLYVFVVGIDDGRYYSSGASPSVVGTDVGDLRDAEGKPIGHEMVQLAKEGESATYSYVWRNPANNKMENKHSLIQRVDRYVVGVGYYTR